MEKAPQNVTALDGKDATIWCRAVGAPNPNITWIYNGKSMAAENAITQLHASISLYVWLFVVGVFICKYE